MTGYFPPLVSALFTRIERLLARRSTCLIAVSEEVRDDLVRLRVAPPERIVVVVPLGFNLSRFEAPEEERRARRETFRASLGIPLEAPLVTLVGRLEPIKRVDRFLRVANLIEQPRAWFLVVGDGSLRERLEESPEATSLGERLVWAGLREDMPDVYFATDVLAVTSDNEGTAVTAIEAEAAGIPVVTTGVGGMSSVVEDDATGFVVDREDERRFAASLDRLVSEAELARRLGATGADRAHRFFALDRLVDEIANLYDRLLDGSRRGQS